MSKTNVCPTRKYRHRKRTERMKRTDILKLGLGVLLCLQSGVVEAALPAQSAGADDAGAQLNQTREQMERERLAGQLEAERTKDRSGVQDKRESSVDAESQSVKFLLKRVDINESQVFTKAELDAVSRPYIGKEVSLQDLYDMVKNLNRQYQERGYVTCRAKIPPQTIQQGIVKIELFEGRTGELAVEGNRSTRQGYIKDRLHLQPGHVDNIHSLNKDLLRFNAVNDVQLRISMKAGKAPGTTDYEIKAKEPDKREIDLYTDNAGTKSTGYWRQGIFYTERSLSGVRDTLSLGFIRSSGNHSWSAQYAYPLGTQGLQLRLQYNRNSMHITGGEMEAMQVEGNSSAYGAALVQPLVVTDKIKTEVALEYSNQKAKTDFMGIHWVDDQLKDYTLSYNVTRYGKNMVWYQKIGYTRGNAENIDGNDRSYDKYQLDEIYQRGLSKGKMLKLRFNGQWSKIDYMPSAKEFYIGGAYSVRGYAESQLGGDSGFSLSAEYSAPIINPDTAWFAFFDCGAVYGASSFDDNKLASVGFGIRSTIRKKYTLSLTAGLPLIKELNGTSADSIRLHFMMNGQL